MHDRAPPYDPAFPMHTETINYQDDSSTAPVTCQGFLATVAPQERRPVVLVAHAWGGQDDFAREKANMLAGIGFVGFAIDMYGVGADGAPRRGSTNEENAALMQPFLDDRAMLRNRIQAAVKAASAHPAVDPQRVAVIGFCFGGLCSLDLVRSGMASVQAAAVFHGLYTPPGPGPQGPIHAKVLVMHPFDDPMAPPDSVIGLAKELTAAEADWQIHMYGHTMHAFTNPAAAAPELGLRYQERSANRAFAAMEHFLHEVFGKPGAGSGKSEI